MKTIRSVIFTCLFYMRTPLWIGTFFVFLAISFSGIGSGETISEFFLHSLGGIQSSVYAGYFPLVEIGRWLLMIFYWLVIIGDFLAAKLGGFLSFELQHSRSYFNWECKTYLIIFIFSFGFTAIGILTTGVCFFYFDTGMINPKFILFLVQMTFTLCGHFFFYGILLLLSSMIFKQYMHAVIAITLLEGISIFIALEKKEWDMVLPGTWGMLIRYQDGIYINKYKLIMTALVQIVASIIAALVIYHTQKKTGGKLNEKRIYA